jgi:CubicO group peptidase (beta-lactamase class C family)
MHQTRYFVGFIATLLCSGELVSGQSMAFPDKEWETATPPSQGVNNAKLNVAIEYLKDHSGSDGVKELVVVRNGRLIWQGTNSDNMHGVWSCTKSFTSTVLGLLIDDGQCTLDTPAKSHLPALAETYPRVTLKHFATMTSGYRAVGDGWRKEGYTHGPSETPFQPAAEPLFTPPGSAYA